MSEPLEKSIGRYRLKKSLGKGGMGEVFLAFDTLCARLVALKQIRPDMLRYPIMKERFLKEAHIAAGLTHPAIIPIYSIDADQTYYTMPYIEGETLKNILRETYQLEKKGKLHPIGSSIPALVRLFLPICQAIAYCHSKLVLHRDLKPENIIIGKYGEVLLIDWGLACMVDQSETEEEELPHVANTALTRPGKTVGTLLYMAPERAFGAKSSTLSDIYSLGVILYQLLTLRAPFERTTPQQLRKHLAHERILDPLEVAPYRDIPKQLSSIALKCLCVAPEERYQTVDALIKDLEQYSTGQPEWVLASTLQIEKKQDWEFQENILLAKHIAITRGTDVMEWVVLMVSKESFAGPTKIETRVRLQPQGEGIGFLLSIPESKERKSLEEGYCLWIGSALKPSVKLFKSNVEVMSCSDVGLEANTWYDVRIEKTHRSVLLFLNNMQILSYISHLPLMGTHIGLLYRDAHFSISDLHIFIGSSNAMVSCLSIPDAFLEHKDFSNALLEYRRIATCFSGRTEGREALFRAGITLLQEALYTKKQKEKKHLFQLALDEFEKLHGTPGAPLEYLGKSLVYKALGDTEEEVKCVELGLRKYPKHPLLPILVEHITFRLHEASYNNRAAAYRYALLCLCHLPNIFLSDEHKRLIDSLHKHWQPLPFLEDTEPSDALLSIQLSFWLNKPLTLLEIQEKNPKLLKYVLYSLLELGYKKKVKERLGSLPEEEKKSLEQALVDKSYPLIPLFSPYYDLWQLLLQKKWEKAKLYFDSLPSHLKDLESSPIYFLYGAFLAGTKGKDAALSFFKGALNLSYLPTPALLAAYLHGKIDLKKGWITEGFLWEKIELFRELILFYHCVDDLKHAKFFERKLKSCLKNDA